MNIRDFFCGKAQSEPVPDVQAASAALARSWLDFATAKTVANYNVPRAQLIAMLVEAKKRLTKRKPDFWEASNLCAWAAHYAERWQPHAGPYAVFVDQIKMATDELQRGLLSQGRDATASIKLVEAIEAFARAIPEINEHGSTPSSC